MDAIAAAPKRKGQFPKGKSPNPGGKRKDGLPKRMPDSERQSAIRLFEEMCIRDEGTPLRKLAGKKDRWTVEEIMLARPYLENVFMRMKLGTAAHIERFVWEHLGGKPVIRVAAEKPEDSPLALALKDMKAEEVRVLAAVARRMIALKAAAPKQLTA